MTKAQIDRLGDRLRSGSTDSDDLIALAAYRNDFEAPTKAVRRRITSCTQFVKVDVSERPSKSTQSIVAKLIRERMRLSQMQDIGGVRIVVPRAGHQDQVVGLLRKEFDGARVVDRRVVPQNGYRAVHVVVRQDGRILEIQVRTQLQNSWAQSSEKLADKYGHVIKYEGSRHDITKRLVELGDLLGKVEARERGLDTMRRAAVQVMLKARRGGRLSDDEMNQRDGYQRATWALTSLRRALESSLRSIGDNL